MSAFKWHNVDMFYNNVRVLFQKTKFLPHQIWNVDLTGITTVQAYLGVIMNIAMNDKPTVFDYFSL